MKINNFRGDLTDVSAKKGSTETYLELLRQLASFWFQQAVLLTQRRVNVVNPFATVVQDRRRFGKIKHDYHNRRVDGFGRQEECRHRNAFDILQAICNVMRENDNTISNACPKTDIDN